MVAHLLASFFLCVHNPQIKLTYELQTIISQHLLTVKIVNCFNILREGRFRFQPPLSPSCQRYHFAAMFTHYRMRNSSSFATLLRPLQPFNNIAEREDDCARDAMISLMRLLRY